MVKDHSLKQQIRDIRAIYPEISYTKARDVIAKRTAYKNSLNAETFFHFEDRETHARISEALKSGRDLIVMGGAGSGKSTAILSILSGSGAPSYFLDLYGNEFEWLDEDSNISILSRVENNADQLEELDLRSSIVAIDEIRRSVPSQIVETLNRAKNRIFCVHAFDISLALERARDTAPKLQFNDPLFLFLERDLSNGEFGLNLLEPQGGPTSL